MLTAKFGVGLMADFAKVQSAGKIDAVGIFNQFNAWGFPCNRSWFIIVSTLDVSEQDVIHVGLRKRGKKTIETLGAFDVHPKESKINQAIIARLSSTFNEAGDYELKISLQNSRKTLKIPFKVLLLPWPEFSEVDINTISTNKHIPRKININVSCQECSHVYIFEEALVPGEPITGGTINFPENGVFECTKCGHILNLKDIQGLVRSSIKEIILSQTKS